MKHLLITFAFIFISTISFSQKKQTVAIESSIVCEMCIDRLDNMFADMWAVKSVDYNVADQTILVKYNSRKISAEQIKKQISEAGYDADNLKANQEAHDNLPKCCQKSMKPH